MRKPLFIAKLLAFVWTLFYSCFAFGQDKGFENLVDKTDAYNKSHPVEKVYLQTDQPFYTVGNSIWIKGYILDARTGLPHLSSKVLYVDLLSASQTVVAKRTLKATVGGASGDIFLSDSLAEGVYKLVAYTGLMKHYGEEYYFSKEIKVTNPYHQKSFLESNQVFINDRISVNGTLKDKAGNALAETKIRYQIKTRNKVLKKGTEKTTLNGLFSMIANWDTAKIKDDVFLEMTYEVGEEKVSSLIGLNTEKPQPLVEFYPEGGDLVKGLRSKVAFRAVDKYKRIVNITGELQEDGVKLYDVQSLHDGMGFFVLAPKEGKKYTLKYSIEGSDEVLVQDLPQAKEEGVVIQSRTLDNNGVYLSIYRKDKKANDYYVLVQGRQQVLMSMALQIPANKAATKIRLPWSNLVSGVNRITLFDSKQRPIAERLVFVNKHDFSANAHIKANKKSYKKRDKVQLSLTLEDSTGRPMSGHLSATVVDKQAFTPEHFKSGIQNYCLLQSDLSNPTKAAYNYLESNPFNMALLDLLMMTDGWRRFTWKDVVATASETDLPEREEGITVKGKMKSVWGKPLKNGNIMLMEGGNMTNFVFSSTNREGEFELKNLYLLDTVTYLLQGTKKRGSSHVMVELDTAKALPSYLFPKWSPNKIALPEEFIAKTDKIYQVDTTYKVGFDTRLLDELEIVGSRDDIEDERKDPMLSVADNTYQADDFVGINSARALIERVLPGVVFRTDDVIVEDAVTGDQSVSPSGMGEQPYYRSELVGVSLDGLLMDFEMFSSSFMAGAIEKVEVYKNAMLSEANVIVAVYTKDGSGMQPEASLGLNLVKNLGFYTEKQFPAMDYSERKPIHIKPDYRTRLAWKPWIVMNKEGKTQFDFYTADEKSEYMVIIEGVAENGQLVREIYDFTVK